MQVCINGEERNIPESSTITDLLKFLGVAEGHVAVERNQAIVARDHWPSLRIETGDNLEIVHFVGGG